MEGTLGEIRMFGGNFAPRNWAFCAAQLLPINSNQALFSILGCTFGGDCRTTFGLPDLRGRRAVHPGHGPGLSAIQLGQKGGAEYHTMTTTEMPNHGHDITGSVSVVVRPKIFNDEATTGEPDGTYYALSDGNNIYSNNLVAIDGTLGATETTVTTDVEIANAGGGQQFYKDAPFQAVYYIICTSGLFPSRN